MTIARIDWKRTIYLGQPQNEEACGIDSSSSKTLIKGIEKFRGDRPIYILFNNDGGKDNEARFSRDIIRSCPQNVIGVVCGRAESAAAWLLQGCDWRVMMPRSNLMLHMGSKSVDAHSEWADKMFVDDVLRRMQEKDPAYPRNKLVKELKRDWYVYPTQALALGLIDQIWEPTYE
jgi:ATP-dependent protease ClpP protease subunit